MEQRQEVNDNQSEEEDAFIEAQIQAMRERHIRQSARELEFMSNILLSHSDSEEEEEDDDDDDDYDDDEDDDDSHHFMPRMVLDPRVDTGSFLGVDDATSSDGSEPPPLIARPESNHDDNDSDDNYVQQLVQHINRMHPPVFPSSSRQGGATRTGVVQGGGSLPQSTATGRSREHNHADGIVSRSAGSVGERNLIEPRSGAIRDVVFFMRRGEPRQVWKLTANGRQPHLQLEDIHRGVSMLNSTTAFAVVTRGPHPHVVNYGILGEPLCGYHIDNNVQIVVDGSAFWTLGPIAGASNTSMLKYYSSEFPHGKAVRRVSSESTLYRGCLNSCWVHVRQRTTHIDSGLWFFKTNGQKHILNSSAISPHALIAPNVDKSVWMMQRSNSRTVLRRVGFVERNNSSDFVACDCTRQSSLITNAHGGVYIHTRKDGQWSLLVYKNSTLRTLTAGHRDAKLTVDQNGNAWILKKRRTSHHLRLLKIDAQNDAVLDVPGNFDDVSILTGAY